MNRVKGIKTVERRFSITGFWGWGDFLEVKDILLILPKLEHIGHVLEFWVR